ncbi:hypothetical protein CPB85DRAFT_1459469 [Mucidula mucida]|nr:hypothetical protein CPB85DRAFT_1459469 [Mucidula mucida]
MFPSRRYAAIMLADVLDIFRDLHSAVLSTVLVMCVSFFLCPVSSCGPRNIRTDHGDQNTNSSASIRKLQCYEFNGSTSVCAGANTTALAATARASWCLPGILPALLGVAQSATETLFFLSLSARDLTLYSPAPALGNGALAV